MVNSGEAICLDDYLKVSEFINNSSVEISVAELLEEYDVTDCLENCEDPTCSNFETCALKSIFESSPFPVSVEDLVLGEDQITWKKISFNESTDQEIVDHYLTVFKIFCAARKLYGKESYKFIDWRNYFTGYGHTQADYLFGGNLCLDGQPCFWVKVVPYNGVHSGNWAVTSLEDTVQQTLTSGQEAFRFGIRFGGDNVNLNIFVLEENARLMKELLCL